MRLKCIFLLLLLSLMACAPKASPSLPETVYPVYPVPAEQAEMFSLINEARAMPRYCGDGYFAAAAPLRYHPLLSEAAKAHALDMSQHQFFSHSGSDGSNVGTRTTRAGYLWASVGENLAYGSLGVYSEAEIVAGWLKSPGHCQNIMNAQAG